MEQLLQIAKANAEQAEIYYTNTTEDIIQFEDSNLKSAKTNLTSGVALRVIKDGKIGFAYTCNLLNRDDLVKQALNSAVAGAKVQFDFPKTEKVIEIKTYDPQIKNLDKKRLVEETKEVIRYIKSKCDAQIHVYIYNGTIEKGIINSSGTNLCEKKSDFSFVLTLFFPGTANHLSDSIYNRKQVLVMDKAKIDQLLGLYALNKERINLPTAKMPVILMPKAVHSFVGRFDKAIHPAAFENKTSPLLNKLEQKIFSDQLTIYQDPLDDSYIEASAFDGEGVACQKTIFVDKGIFKNFYTDLNYAARLNTKSTGNGGRNGIESPVNPKVNYYSIAVGNKSLAEMIAGIEEGILIYSLMDIYTGNTLAGDYSVGVATGFYIKNGKLIGRVKECMISGNIYETLNRISAIENEVHFFGYGNMPAIAFEEISVAGAE